jgi:hypothetical protein
MIYTLGGIEFKNKASITKYFRDYLKNHNVGNILDGEAHNIMMDLIQWHHECMPECGCNFKIGCGEFKEKMFKVSDGTRWRVYSYLKCIRAGDKNTNNRSNVIRACRTAIRHQIKEYLTKMAIDDKWRCEISNNLYDRADIHIDHDFTKITFQKLLDGFLKDNRISYADVILVQRKFGAVLNEEDHRLWCEYHQKHATIRAIHKNYNLARSESPK